MKNKLILCLALVLSGFSSKADDKEIGVDQNTSIEEFGLHEIPECFTNYSAVSNQKALKGDFAVRTDLGWVTAMEYKRLKLDKRSGVTNGVTQVSSPFGSKAYGILSLDDSTKISPDEIVVHVVVFQNDRPKWTFDFKGFDDFDADWIDEKTLKIVYWPGTHAKATELIDVEAGKVIYKSQYGIYDEPEKSSDKK